jgi:hypothetical protein
MQSGINKFELEILIRAELEIDEIADYYESLSEGLGTKFNKEASEYISTLKNFPFFEEKYNIIRKLPLKKFPYTINFTVDEHEKIVSILSITCDYLNPTNTRIRF